jgi:hypothetical protein
MDVVPWNAIGTMVPTCESRVRFPPLRGALDLYHFPSIQIISGQRTSIGIRCGTSLAEARIHIGTRLASALPPRHLSPSPLGLSAARSATTRLLLRAASAVPAQDPVCAPAMCRINCLRLHSAR